MVGILDQMEYLQRFTEKEREGQEWQVYGECLEEVASTVRATTILNQQASLQQQQVRAMNESHNKRLEKQEEAAKGLAARRAKELEE